MSRETELLLEDFTRAVELDPAHRRALIESLEADSRAAEARELERLLELDRAEGPLAREPQASGSREPAADKPAPAGEPRAPAPPPFTDDKYEILGEIGEGAFGHIYRARHRSLKREVALKVHRNVPESCRARFLAEAQALARVNHPNIVTIHDVHDAGSDLRLELELVQGENFHQIIERAGPLAPREAALVALDLCRALAAIHAAGLVHMDVKPANVMRANGGRIVLLDFGLTRHGASDPHVPIGGTPAFMAPECYLPGAAIGPAADVYALGVTLYWLVSGRYPFPTRMLQRLSWQAEHREPRPLLDLRPDLPPAFVALVARAMQRRPEERFTSMGDMEAALARFLAESPAPRRPRAVVLGVAAMALALGGLLWWRATRTPAFQLEHAFWLEHAGEKRVLEENAVVHTGDKLWLTIHAPEPVFLYLFQEDDQGRRMALYPVEDGLPNPLPAGELSLPSGPRWELQESGGTDHMYLLASAVPLAEAESLWRELPKPTSSDTSEPANVEGVLRGLEVVLRGGWGREHLASEAPASLASLFDAVQRDGQRPDVFLRRLDLLNP